MPVASAARGRLSADTGLPLSPHSFLGDRVAGAWPCKLVPETGGQAGSRVSFFYKDPQGHFVKDCFIVNVVYLQWAGPCPGHFLLPVGRGGTCVPLTPFPF